MVTAFLTNTSEFNSTECSKPFHIGFRNRFNFVNKTFFHGYLDGPFEIYYLLHFAYVSLLFVIFLDLNYSEQNSIQIGWTNMCDTYSNLRFCHPYKPR